MRQSVIIPSAVIVRLRLNALFPPDINEVERNAGSSAVVRRFCF
jgi:hypothetical protein